MQAPRILVVDDEAHVRNGLVLSLQLSGYAVDGAASGREALERLAAGPYDLVVLDMLMPEMDGVTTMRHVRASHPDLPIVILTGHATLESAIAAVKSGAVDYLLKPVGVHDVRAVVERAIEAHAAEERRRRALTAIGAAFDELRGAPSGPRAAPTPSGDVRVPLRYGRLTLDPERRTVTVAGPEPRSAELTDGEAALLRTLIERRGEVLACRALARSAWGYDLEEAAAVSAVRSCIYRLRGKIELDPDAPALIRTVRGGGYYLAL